MLLMKSFAEAFFRTFGAKIEPDGEEWVVDLPPDLADSFGQARLYLVFSQAGAEPRPLSPTEDLLVYGSRTFDRMLALLEGRGEATWLRLSGQAAVTEGEALPLPLHNCRAEQVQTHVREEPYFIFNFRTVYVSDEKQVEVVTVILDEQGRPAVEAVGELAGFDPVDPAGETPPVEADAIRRLFDRAGEVARRQVDGTAAELEQAIRPRLEKTVLRLTAYYRRLIDEVDTGQAEQDGAIRTELQQDLARKIGDELERHRLRISLQPLSYALALAPFADYRASLATRHTVQTLTLARNMHTGQLQPLLCHHCGQPIDRLALCDNGHTIHPHCVNTCHRCEREVCRRCGIEACGICGHSTCAACVETCAYCDRWLCAGHLSTCAICGRSCCSDHAGCCRWCGQSYCQQCLAGQDCESCRRAMAAPELPLPSSITVAGLEIGDYRWRQAENGRFRIYIGRRTGLFSPLRAWAIIVTDKAGQIVHWQKVSSLKRLIGQ
jgi:hypothetical protein